MSALRYVIDQSWFLMISSYSRRFCLDFTQCGPLFAVSLTDHGGNNSTLDLNISKKDSIAPFLQAIGHLTLASDVDVGDDPNFRTFGGSYDMIFPYAEGYLSSLKITNLATHSTPKAASEAPLTMRETPRCERVRWWAWAWAKRS